MPERIDRSIGGNRWLLWSLAVLLAAAVAFLAWERLSAPTAPRTAPAPSPQQPARLDEPLPVTLYYPADGMLVAVPASVPRRASTQELGREVLAALFADSHASRSPVLNEVRLRAFFLDDAGTGYVDLSPVRQDGVRASAGDEFLAMYTLVDVLEQNFEEIKRVRFLLEGREAQTLAGHIDLTRMFEKRMDLVKQ